MIMKNLILFIGLVMLSSCANKPKESIKERIALEEIVYQRTEGLLILEKLLDFAECEKTNMLCQKIKFFYENSQPNLLSLCKNRNLNLTMNSYDEINQDIEKLIIAGPSYQSFLMDKLLTNFKDQKAFYLYVLEDKELANLHYYSLDSYLQMVSFMDDMNYLMHENLAVR